MHSHVSQMPGFMGWWHRLNLALQENRAMIAHYGEAAALFVHDNGEVEIDRVTGLRMPTPSSAARRIIDTRANTPGYGVGRIRKDGKIEVIEGEAQVIAALDKGAILYGAPGPDGVVYIMPIPGSEPFMLQYDAFKLD